MLGCGDTPEQVISTMEKVRAAGVDVITFGQCMRPSKRHMPVSEYVTPEAFDKYRVLGEEMVHPSVLQVYFGFSHNAKHL
jgi:lipoyl synthase